MRRFVPGCVGGGPGRGLLRWPAARRPPRPARRRPARHRRRHRRRHPKPTPKPAPKPPAVNPLTGRPGVPRQPVVVVKIDDTASGRPQIGLESADVVYVEQVEGGLTRLAAVFASRQPTQVGPVRSVRNTDPELLASTASPALAYSGGAGVPVGRLRSSAVIDAGPQRVGGAYRRTRQPAGAVQPRGEHRPWSRPRCAGGGRRRGTSACTGPGPTRGWPRPGGCTRSR